MKKIYVTCNSPEKKQLDIFVQRFCESHDYKYSYFQNLALTTSNDDDFDGAIVLNGVPQEEKIKVVPANVVAFMMEPGIKGEHNWMYEGLEQFGKVISPLNNSANTLQEHGYISWGLPQSRQYLLTMPLPEKTHDVSCISSGKSFFEGHKKRLKFVRYLEKQNPSFSYFGFDGHPFLHEKTTGLAPFRFSVAIENSSINNYFTEKINDCFLMYTTPLYYGCTNIDKFFPKGSYTWVDINNYEKAVDTINEAVANFNWQKQLPLLQEARELVLKKYHCLARMEQFMHEIKEGDEKKIVTLHPVKNSFSYKIYKKLKMLVDKR